MAMRLLSGELVGDESTSWRRDDRESNRFKAIEDRAPQEWSCTVEGVEGVWGVCAGVGQNFATCRATTSLVSSPSP